MTTPNPRPLPSSHQLFKATALAVAVAAAILVTAVLPAEHGIDPTGIGKALGLTKLNAVQDEAEAVPVLASPAVSASPASENAPPARARLETVTTSDVPFRSDEMSLTLQPNEGKEIKALMRKGEQFVFRWKATGGKVNFDMHGERVNAGADFTSYWKDTQQSAAQGVFIAPFEGTHGWFWRNRGNQPVTVTVNVSGFYASLKQPE
ncbi:MAG: hypothetical protein IV085_03915 [Thiobacillus sp.]|nr:hypothetical protein [Thiobacillus sp.]